jgi:hypothetical protein
MTAQGIKIQPPMQNIIKRKLKTDMGANFEDWAYQYFSEDGENLDKNISREEALENFRKFANLPRITMQRFTKALKAFAELCPYIYCLNPPEILNSAGRNMQKVENKTIEMIHLRTVTQQKMIDDGAALQKAVERKETEVPFAPVEEKDGAPF